jgi:hypothetical protein
MATVDHTRIVHTLNAIARDAAAALAALKHNEGEPGGEHVAAVAALLCSIGLRADTALPTVGCPPLRSPADWLGAA